MQFRWVQKRHLCTVRRSVNCNSSVTVCTELTYNHKKVYATVHQCIQYFLFLLLFFNSIFTLIFYFCRSANIFTYIYMIFTCTCRLVTVWETQWMLYSPWKTWSAISVMLNRFLMQGMQNTWRSFTETAGRLVEREKNNLSDQKRLAHFRIPFQLVT